jgi:hypothetical protein
LHPTPTLQVSILSLPTTPVGAHQQPPPEPAESNPRLGNSDELSAAASTLPDDAEAICLAAAMVVGQTSHFVPAEDEERAEGELTGQQSAERRISRERAREFARDAWDQARSALEFGDAKPSAR